MTVPSSRSSRLFVARPKVMSMNAGLSASFAALMIRRAFAVYGLSSMVTRLAQTTLPKPVWTNLNGVTFIVFLPSSAYWQW